MTEGFGIDPEYFQTTGTRRKVFSNVSKTVLVVLGTVLILTLFSVAFDARVDGPAGSSIVTTDQGYGAWREVLEELGIPTNQLKVSLDEAVLPADARLVVVSPDPALIDADYVMAIQRFLDRGGIVITTEGDIGLMGGLGTVVGVLADSPSDEEMAVVGEFSDVAVLRVPGLPIDGSARIDIGERLVQSQDGQAVFVSRPGNVILLSDMGLLTNQNLGEADNGILAVRLAGEGPVYFDEYVHGFGAGQGVAGLPAGMVSVVLILVATVVWMWAVGARFGPPQQPHRALPPPRAAYLDGIAVSLAKSKPSDAGFGVLRTRARTMLDLYSERFTGAQADDRRRAAATALGITDEELASLDQPTTSSTLAVQAASVVAKVQRSRTVRTDES